MKPFQIAGKAKLVFRLVALKAKMEQVNKDLEATVKILKEGGDNIGHS